jgi:hypothetical protein
MSERARLRGATLVAGPLFVIGLMGASFAIALGLWALWHPGSLGASFWVPFGVAAVAGVIGFVGSRGCYVELVDDELRDVVGWIPVQRIDRRRVTEARVRLGVWRWFELELDDGSLRTLLGSSPAQFPMHLLPGSDARDLGDLAMLSGHDPS